MSIDFSTLQGLTIPEGAVTQITDSAGRVIWAVASDKVILEVEKITSDTYAGETTYTAEEFILLDIYPKTASSTVKVTYGGLTKTLTFSGINAQQVYFGTFNGVTDSVTTPASGTLVIEGGCNGFACGVYQSGSKATNKGYCSCITDIVEWGNVTSIGDYAFYNCTSLALTSLPSGLTSIGNYAFYGCTSLALTSLPSGVTSIGAYAFYRCYSITLSSLPSGITIIESYTFFGCYNIAVTSIPNGVTSIGDSAFEMTAEGIYGGLLANVNMTEITIPATVTSVGAYAFSSDNKEDGMADEGYLQKITMLGTTPPTITGTIMQGTSFGDRDYGTIYVPKGCGDIYKTADGWTYYANSIVEVP